MAIKISHDPAGPAASMELMITHPLPDYDLLEVAAPIPREVDPMLASQGFLDLLDDVRAHLGRELAGKNLEIVQLTGAICRDRELHRPGIWLILRERGATQKMAAESQQAVASIAENIRATFQLS